MYTYIFFNIIINNKNFIKKNLLKNLNFNSYLKYKLEFIVKIIKN